MLACLLVCLFVCLFVCWLVLLVVFWLWLVCCCSVVRCICKLKSVILTGFIASHGTFQTQFILLPHWYCWWKKSCTSWYVVYPSGAGFLPSNSSSSRNLWHIGWFPSSHLEDGPPGIVSGWYITHKKSHKMAIWKGSHNAILSGLTNQLCWFTAYQLGWSSQAVSLPCQNEGLGCGIPYWAVKKGPVLGGSSLTKRPMSFCSRVTFRQYWG